MAYSERVKNNENDKKSSWRDTIGNYMRDRLDKLDQQVRQKCHDTSANENSYASNLFDGISIHIDGYTEPSSDILREMVVGGGGKSVHWFSKTTVTHVVATSLARTKIKQWGEDVRIVKPEWITESCKANRLLPWKEFKLYSDDTGVNTINQAFSRPKSASPKKAGDDGFISEFYCNSRLHHLSDWRMKLKNFVADRKKHNVDKSYPGLEKLLATPTSSSDSTCAEETDAYIMHIDMDCFFVSVGLLSHPHLVGQPVVVTHSQGRKPVNSAADGMSYSEIACCSYEARAMGIRNGMLLGHAQKLCPDLAHIPYEFDKYDEISHIFYKVLLGFTDDIEPVSCDEAYVDLTSVMKQVSGRFSTELVISRIRNDIFKMTSCRCSAGIGKNRLVARLCTKKAKPDGQFIVNNFNAAAFEEFLGQQKISDLPGVGHVMTKKLCSSYGEHMTTCADLQSISLNSLISVFGPRTGQFLHDSCRGTSRESGLKAQETRKSVSAEINYGMRFVNMEEVKKFLAELVDEVVKRLREADVKGRQLHLKLLIRSQNAPKETKKYLGHGACDAFSKSARLDTPCNTAGPILNACTRLLFGNNGNGIGEFGQIDATDVRGIGIQLTKLIDATPQANTNPLVNAFAKTGVKRPRPVDTKLTKKVVEHTPQKSLRQAVQRIKSTPRPTLIGACSLPDVCSLIDEWLSASDTPCADDLEMIVGYFVSVIDYGDIGHVYDVLRHMRKQLNQQQQPSDLWKNAFDNAVLFSVKQKIKHVYGAGAEIPSI